MAEPPRPDVMDAPADPDFVPLFDWLARPDQSRRRRSTFVASMLLAAWHVGLFALLLIEAGQRRETGPGPRGRREDAAGGRGAGVVPSEGRMKR